MQLNYFYNLKKNVDFILIFFLDVPEFYIMFEHPPTRYLPPHCFGCCLKSLQRKLIHKLEQTHRGSGLLLPEEAEDDAQLPGCRRRGRTAALRGGRAKINPQIFTPKCGSRVVLLLVFKACENKLKE